MSENITGCLKYDTSTTWANKDATRCTECALGYKAVVENTKIVSCEDNTPPSGSIYEIKECFKYSKVDNDLAAGKTLETHDKFIYDCV